LELRRRRDTETELAVRVLAARSGGRRRLRREEERGKEAARGWQRGG